MKLIYLLLFLGCASNALAITDTPTVTPTSTVTASFSPSPSATATYTSAATITISPTSTALAALGQLSSGTALFVYPDPVKAPDASLAVSMAGSGTLELKVYNLGAELVLVAAERLNAGPQRVQFSIGKLPPGVYLYRCKFTFDSGKTENSRLQKFRVLS